MSGRNHGSFRLVSFMQVALSELSAINMKTTSKAPAVLVLAATLILSGFSFAGEARAQATGTVTGIVATTTTGTGTSTASSTTSTGTTTDLTTLQNRVYQLEMIVASLQSELSSLKTLFQTFLNGQSGTGTSTGSNTGTTTSAGGTSGNSNATTSMWVRIYPETASIRSGTNVDFNGRGFWAGEDVVVSRSGQTVAVGHADGGGNFSTGSLPVGSVLGSQTYSFRGSWSGLAGTSVIQIVPEIEMDKRAKL
jgi:hypothetical protein